MRGRTGGMALAAITSIALVATACGGGGTEPQSEASQPAGQAGGEIVVAGCTPENPLIPGNTSETCGGDIIDAMTSKLVEYNTENAAPENDIAESIETTDNKLFTVKLKPYKFHDGTEVKAKNFVDAWNYTAYGPNGQAGSGFYAPVAGFADVQCPDRSASRSPRLRPCRASRSSTTRPSPSRPPSRSRTCRCASATPPSLRCRTPSSPIRRPLRRSRSGPARSRWTRSATPSSYSPSSPTSVAPPRPTWTSSPSASTRILRRPTPTPWLAASTTSTTATSLLTNSWGTRTRTTSRIGPPSGNRWSWAGSRSPPNDPQLKDNVDLRKAISRAIDRDLIVKQIFSGTRIPATGWVSPAVDGFKAGACGDSCTFDAAAAKTAFEAAGGYKGTLTMTYNADAPNKAWSEAVCNSIKNTLGIECVAVPTVDFATFNKKLDADELKGIFRSAWQADYPSIENYLTPIYAKAPSPRKVPTTPSTTTRSSRS